VTESITENDLTVEYLQWDQSRPVEWCVLRRGQILAHHLELDSALAGARDVMRVEQCAGWFVPASGAAPIKIA
jgi:hypothetical protein